jgi:hypothetical protein
VLFEPSRHGHEASVADRLSDLREQARRADRDRVRTTPDGPARPERPRTT